MNSNRYLFLDFDGVLHPASTGTKDLFCRAPLLSELLADQPCNVVISSSWRFNSELSHLKSKLPNQLAKLIVGVTGPPEICRWPRYSEIKQYLKKHRPLAEWRALDDALLEFPRDCPELIFCHPRHGITISEITKLASWLRN